MVNQKEYCAHFFISQVTLTVIVFLFVQTAFSATFTVTRSDDRNMVCNSGVDCSLREAVNAANAAVSDDVINFSSGVSLITLTGTELVIQNNGTLSINGLGANALVVNGGIGMNRVLRLNRANVTITNISLTGGNGVGADSPIVDGNGGALLSYLSTMTLNNVHIFGNSVSSGGGGFYVTGGTGLQTRIINSTISNNTATSGGGLLYTGAGTLEIINTTISSNQANNSGGGMFLPAQSSTYILNSTIVTNSASSGGGYSTSVDTMSGTIYMRNTIIAGNTGSIPEISYPFGNIISLGNNLIGDSPGDSTNTGSRQISYQTTDIRDTSPILGFLQNNGGTTPTHALLVGSPAINSGSNESPPPTDQRGFTRIISGTIDIGAFEQQLLCELLIDSTAQKFPQTGGTGSFAVLTESGCQWLAQTDFTWISILGNGSGNGNGTIQFSVQPNSGASRSGTIKVGGRSFLITQTSGCSPSITPPNIGIATDGGSGSFNVISGQGCQWNAVSNHPWITLNSGSGTGNGTVTFTVQANTGDVRSGTISVGGQTFTVNQAASCAYSLAPDSTSFPSSGGSGSFNVTTFATCNWNAVSNASWIFINSGSGTGNGAVSFTVQPNVQPARSGTITVAGQTYTINQSSGCSISLSSQSVDFSPNGGSGSFSINVGAGCPWTVSTNATWITITSTPNGSGGTVVTFTIQPNSGASRTATINVSGQTFTVNQAAFITTNRNNFDFDGDGKSDVSVYRPSDGVWYLNRSQTGFTGIQFGISTDKLVPADYDGDRKTDLAVYRNGVWYLLRSTAGFTGIQFGTVGDIPQPADYDGDGKSEIAVYRPSDGVWYVLNLQSNQFTTVEFGISTDKPVVGDYDGDGKANYAVYRPSAGSWYIARPTGIPSQNFDAIAFGEASDIPVQADYDGDGKTDAAVYRSGIWYLLRSQLGFTGIQFGIQSDLPVPADYDGDGKTDPAVFRPNQGAWYLLQSQAGFTGIQFGISSDKPVQSAYVH